MKNYLWNVDLPEINPTNRKDKMRIMAITVNLQIYQREKFQF